MSKDEGRVEHVLLGAGPHGSYILMCSCGAVEVTREPREWRRFKPCYRQRRCYCEDCAAMLAMEILEEDFYGADRKAQLDALSDAGDCTSSSS